MINITTPKYLPYFQILLRTRKYYKLRGISNIVEGDEKKYYIFLKKRCVQIQIVNFEKEAIDEIQKYLDCVFKDDYIGIQEKYIDVFALKKGKVDKSNMKDKKLYKWAVFIFLIAVLLIRVILKDEQSKGIQIISLLGVIIALADVYGNLYVKNYKKDKFRIISGLAIIIAFVLMCVLAGMFWNLIDIGSKGNDILTILALLISLPSDLYCDWINKYIDG